MKTIAKYAASAALLAAVAWVGTYFFWHFRLVGAVGTLESRIGTPAADDAHDVIEAAGCRALPYLVGALDAKNQIFLIYASGEIFKSIENLAARNALPDPALLEQARDWKIVPEDNPVDMKRKCDSIRDYWKINERLHHQWWRVWSSKCTP
jgi:hypothetical protein